MKFDNRETGNGAHNNDIYTLMQKKTRNTIANVNAKET